MNHELMEGILLTWTMTECLRYFYNVYFYNAYKMFQFISFGLDQRITLKFSN